MCKGPEGGISWWFEGQQKVGMEQGVDTGPRGLDEDLGVES